MCPVDRQEKEWKAKKKREITVKAGHSVLDHVTLYTHICPLLSPLSPALTPLPLPLSLPSSF